MNWIDILWPMMSAVCLTLALVHFLIGVRSRDHSSHLLFALICISVATIALMEQMAMHAATPAEYAKILRWGHVPFATMIIGIVWFLHFEFRAGSVVLGTAICVIRLASLVANFSTGDNLNFSRLTHLRQVEVWGGQVISTPAGELNSWLALGQLSLVLLVVFLVQVIVVVWRRGNRTQRARVLTVCGSMLAFMVFSLFLAIAVSAFGWRAPITINPAFIPVLLVMSFEMGGDILRTAKLSAQLEKSESSLRKSEMRTALAVRAADIGLWDWELSSEQPWISEAGRRLLGIQGGESFVSARFYRRVHREDRGAFHSALRLATQGEGEFSAEFRLLDGTGGERWLVVRGQMDRTAQGKLARTSGVVADITERKISSLRFQQVAEAAPVAMIMATDDGRIVLANRKAEALFGHSRKDLEGQVLEQVMTFSVDPAEVREPLARHRDGSEMPVELAMNELRLGGESYLLVSIIDISTRKKLERDSLVQRDELAHLSRVALLAELSGSLAHELNQPLTAILSNAQAAIRFLDHSPPDMDEVRSSLTTIVESDKRAGEVIRRLRAMLRNEPADYRQLEINEVVQDVIRIIRSDLLNRNVELTLDLAPRLPSVEGDRVQLQQVLLNLVMNASDAMALLGRGREMTVRTRMFDTNKVVVMVSDVGTGIPEENLERIFTPFVTSKQEGLGLGLAVCTTIIQSHKGKLWASNNPDRGATLSFYLPVSGSA